MNRIYKLKFDRRRNALVVVSELTSGTGKTESTGHVAGLLSAPFRRLLGTLTPLALLTGLVTGVLPMMALANPALPTGGQVVAGSGSISSSGSQMTVQQNSQNMVASWNTFDIGKNNTVQFVQPGSSAVALNRVTGGRESQIMGTLKANGQVMLINPAGVMFGQGAQVSTAGLVASTKNISNADFMKGNYTLSGGGAPGAQIVNQGSLSTAPGGYIVLAADRVSNSGSIRTPGGKTVLAAAERVSLQLDNGGLTSVTVNGSVVNALVENRGLLSATDGQVYLTARGKDMLLNAVVNNSGTVDASGLSAAGGVIRLDGGDSGVVSQSGRLLADSGVGKGGTITLEGQNIHLAAGSLTSATGKTGGGSVSVGGGWQGKDGRIKNASKVVMDKTATVDVSATEKGDGGQAVLWSDEYTDFRGTILAKGGAQSGNGGRVETSSHNNLQAFGRVDASAPNGRGGEWLLDPTDVTIVGSGADSNVDSSSVAGVFTPTASGAQILNTSINDQLNAGTSVTVKTSGVDTPGQWGNITVGAAIEKTAGGDAALTLEADGMLTVSQNIGSTAGRLDISLLGAGSNTGMINVSGSTLSSNGGNITLAQLNHTDASATAMTVKIDGSTLNASGAAANGTISVSAWNPNVSLNASPYNNTVRNGGALLSVTNSTLSGDSISLNSAQSGRATGSLTMYLNNATLAAAQDITLDGNNSTDSLAVSLELRGRNSLTAGGNIGISNVLGSGNLSGATAVFLNGNTAGAANLTAGGNITLDGQSGNAISAFLQNSALTAAGCVTLRGQTTGGSTGIGLRFTNTVNASSLNVTGVNGGSGTGFALSNLTLAGGVANGANVTLSSAGSAAASTNVIGTGVFDAANLMAVMAAGIENMTQVSAAGLTLGNSAGDDWVEDFSSSKGGGWIFDGATVNQTGNISLQGVGFANGSVTAGRDLTIDNGAQRLLLDGTSVSVGGNLLLSGGTLDVLNSRLNGTATAPQAFTLQAGDMLTLGNTSVSAGAGSLDVNLHVADSNTGMINVTGSNVSSNGGNITLSQLSLSGAGDTAMTVKIDGSTLNASGAATNGAVSVSALNPNVNLTASQYNNTVRNGGSLLSVTNSALSGDSITLNSAQSGSNGSSLTAYLNNATLTAAQDITLTGNNGADSRAHGLELRGANVLNAGGNISISNALGDANGSGAIAVFLNGNAPGAANLTAGGNITLNGSGGAAQGVSVNNATLNASAANITGTSRTGGTGFTLSNLTLAGGVANGANVALSSAGSAAAATNSIGDGIFDSAHITALLKAGIENMTQVSAAGLTLGNSAGDDWVEDFSSKGGGWIFDGATVNQTGNISLQGAGFTNGSVTAGKDLTIDNGAQRLLLDGSNVSAGGNITLTANGGVSYVGSDSANHLAMTAGGNVSANASAGTVNIRNADLMSTSGNIDVYGNGFTGVELTNTVLCATAGNISVFGQGTKNTSTFDARGGLTLMGENTFNSLNTLLHGVNTGAAGGGFAPVGISMGSFGYITLNFYGGNASVIGESEAGAGVLWGYTTNSGTHSLNVNTSNFSIDGISRGGMDTEYTPASGFGFTNFDNATTVLFNLRNSSSVSIVGEGINGSGIFNNVSSVINRYVFTGDGNVAIIGKSNDSDGVSIRGFDNSGLNGSMSITGESASGTGVSFNSNLGVNLVNATVTGTSQSGTGIAMEANFGQATLTNVTLSGQTGSGSSAVSLSGTNVSVNGTLNGTVGQGAGAGVSLNGVSNFTVSGAAVNGTAVDGSGLVVTGAVNATDGAVLAGHATGTGNGAAVQGSLTSPDSNATVSGSATGGTGVTLTGTTTGVNVTGVADGGTGVDLANGAQVLNTTVNGTSTSGSGVAVTGGVTLDEATAANLSGHSTDGSGLSLQDGAAITAVQTGTTTPVTSAVQLNGTSVNGSGVSTSGNVTLTTTVLSGSAGDNGTGVTLGGNLTVGDALSGVNATAANGTALALNNVSLNATSHGNPLILNPLMTGDSGTAIQVTGDTSLINVGLNGSSANGSGVVIDGNLTTDQSVTGNTNNGTALTVAGNLVSSGGQPVTGTASGSGTGVSVTGSVGDNHLAGTSA
ncbi:two-partner secretion domain-containing protein, partial [Salmonella enterica]|uniref:two-partner secretion domain-containing protein n=1 Tax=Salmonella enterica TaxID=28901 RepID=UPI003F41BDFD